jgi:hypothetical protein
MMQAYGSSGASAPRGEESFAYGSGHFGEWVTDEYGAPAYHYTCDQLNDPKAVAPTDPIFCGATDQWHQLGNGRLVVKASNFGYMQVRQDEGGPKFLNDYIPTEGEFGGGLGFLSDGNNVIATYYSGAADRFDRVFGLGYFRKTVTAHGYTVEQTVFAPFGDDPLLLTQVTVWRHSAIRNREAGGTKLRWTEYWGCRPYEFFTPEDDSCTQTETHFLRRVFAKRFQHSFEAMGGGLLERKTYTHAASEYLGGLADYARCDFSPPAAFLVPLGDEPTTLYADGSAFFAQGGVSSPEAAKSRLDGRLDASKLTGDYMAGHSARPALLMQRELSLQPGESRTLFSMYGYLTAGQSAAPLVAKYRQATAKFLPETVKAWAKDGLRFTTATEPWVEREAAWSNYYLRSNVTYDSLAEEHVIAQAGAYLYINGSVGGPGGRDGPQHAMPLIFSNPELAKATVRYCLKEGRENVTPTSNDSGHGTEPAPHYLLDMPPSDTGLWQLWLASDYVLATRDRAFLDEIIPSYPNRGPNIKHRTVRQLLARLDHHLRHDVGVGPHGLLRICGGDWNDELLLTHCPADRVAECQEVGESVMSAAMAGYIFDRYAALQAYLGADLREISEIRTFAKGQRDAVSRQWTGQWYRRAWLGPKTGWVGDDPSLWLEPQPWAIISGAAGPDRAKQLAGRLTELVRNPSPIGAMNVNAGSQESELPNQGVSMEGGVWPSLNLALIWALAEVDGDAAWDEWKKNTLARHAEAYPHMWCGILSGPDTYNSVLSKFPGQAMVSDLIRKPGAIMDSVYATDFGMTDFPVMNMHPHAVPLFALTKLIGAEFTPDGLTLAPAVPLDSYSFRSPLLGLERTPKGYSGWYAPSGDGGEWTVWLQVPDANRFKYLKVNGIDMQINLAAGSPVVIHGHGDRASPLSWAVSV